MSTISASTTSTTAYKVTADTTGTLVLQTGSTPTTAVTIDGSQNTNINATGTPAAWGTTGKLYVKQSLASTGAGFLISCSANDGTAFLGHSGSLATLGASYGSTGSYVPLTFETGGSERMRLDASGSLLVGDTSNTTGSPTFYVKPKSGSVAQIAGFNFCSTTSGANPNNNLMISGGYFNGTSGVATATTAASYQHSTGSHYWYGDSGLTIGNTYTSTARMILENGGNLLVGGTTLTNVNTNGGFAVSLSAGQTYTSVGHVTGTGSGSYYHACYYNNSIVGGITQLGTTGVVLTSISDYRLKDEVNTLQGSLAKVLALNPVTYKWKSDNSDGEGFIAHELQAVIPTAATGEKDAVDEEGNAQYQGINLSAIVPHLVKAIQEQQVIIETLTNRINALEAK